MAKDLTTSIPEDQAIHLVPATPQGAVARLSFVMSAYLRVVSLVFLGLTVLVWASAVGYEGFQNVPYALPPFTGQSAPQQVFIIVMAVLYPVTAVGLWSTLSWGRVVWISAILLQVVMGMLYLNPPMRADGLVFFHLTAVALYFTLALVRRVIANRG
ncbi:MAG: DUF6163 family protein [Pseudomonadota bacterium]